MTSYCLLLALLSSPVLAGGWTDPDPFQLSTKELTELQRTGMAAATDDPVYLPFERIEYSYDADGLETQTIHRIYVIRDKAAIDAWGQVGSPYAPWHDNKPSLKARVLSPDGTITELDPSTISDNPSSDRDPTVFSDARMMRAPLPGVRVGSLIEELVVTTEHTPFISGGATRRLSLATFNEVQHRTVRVWADSALPLEWEVGESSAKAKAIKSKGKGKRGVEVVLSPAPSIDSIPSDLPPNIAGFEHLQVSTAPSWATLGSDYGALLASQSDRAGVSRIVESVKAGGGSQRELIDRAYAWVRDEIRYTGVSFGDRAIVPYPPAKVIERGFGDCKDKALLLVTILDELGIPAQVALLDSNSGNEQDLNPDYPGANTFDHAIVFVPSESLWLDPTSQQSSRSLPWPDAGRYALLTGEGAKLVQTPQPSPDEHYYREVRKVSLPLLDYGTVVEHSVGDGWPVENLRDDFDTDDTEAIASGMEDYGANAYGTRTVTNLELVNAADPDAPFDLTATFEGATYVEGGGLDGVVQLYRNGVVDHFPNILLEAVEEGETDPLAERTTDVACFPFRAELVLEIDAHPLYVPRALPESRTITHGPVRLQELYELEEDGDLTVTLAAEASGEALTIEQARALRDETSEWYGLFEVRYDQQGSKLARGGETTAAFRLYSDNLTGDAAEDGTLISMMSETLVSQNLGFAAATLARTRTEGDPTNPEAWGTLGYALMHDDWGRLRGDGYRHDEAIEAFENAFERGSTNPHHVQNLALLYRSGRSGQLYGRDAELDKAITLALDHRDVLTAEQLLNLGRDLTIAGRPTEALDVLDALEPTVTSVGISTAAQAYVEGVDAALQKVAEMGLNNEQQTGVLTAAGQIAQLRRDHRLASAFFTMASTTSQDPIQARRTAMFHAKAKHWEDVFPDGFTDDLRDPERVPIALAASMFSDDPVTSFQAMVTKERAEEAVNSFEEALNGVQGPLRSSTMTPDLMMDFIVSTAEVTSASAGKRLKRVTLTYLGATPEQFYLQKEGREWRIASVGRSAPTTAHLAWKLAKNGDLEDAQTVLGWAMEDAGWRETLRDAVTPENVQGWSAAMMVAQVPDEGLSDAEALLAELTDPLQISVVRGRLAGAYNDQGEWQKVIDVQAPLIALHGRDPYPIQSTLRALHELDRHDEAEALLVSLTESDRPEWKTALAAFYSEQGKFEEARAIWEPLAQLPQPPDGLLNNYAWNLLFSPADPKASAELIERHATSANTLNRYQLHTLAAAYLANEQPDMATSAISAMVKQTKPSAPIGDEWWLVMGGMCEAFGLTDCAREAYTRGLPEEGEHKSPTSTSRLVEQHLEAMDAAAAE